VYATAGPFLVVPIHGRLKILLEGRQLILLVKEHEKRLSRNVFILAMSSTGSPLEIFCGARLPLRKIFWVVNGNLSEPCP